VRRKVTQRNIVMKAGQDGVRAMMKNRLQGADALLIVDAQIDFFPGGALPVPQGDVILPVINQWIKAAIEKNIPVLASRDWHPAHHCSFKEQGGPWPVHCVQNSIGAQIHPAIKLPFNVIIINTADNPDREAYSAFQGKTVEGMMLNDVLKAKGIQRLWVGGLAMDYCVCESALEARKYGYEVHLLLDATRPITPTTGEDALRRMKAAGIILEPDGGNR
jgi:nicotinamidase/pyrazinamidase